MADLRSWIGREEVREDVLTPFFARGMAALLDRDPDGAGEGTPLPRGWHWLYFRPLPRRSDVGPDGHERRGGFLPPVPLPRRMWAGGRLRFTSDLVVGERVSRRSTITSVAEKEGRSGPLVFVTVRHVVEGGKGGSVDEEQHLVYRGGSGSGRAPDAERAPAEAAWTESFVPDPATLFRFSALTYNGHRIHYDHAYATAEEGYPGIVVHGPLTALLLLDACGRNGGRAPDAFDYRAVAPLFVDEEIRLRGRGAAGEGMEAWAAAPDGALAMRGRATWTEATP